jgi:hypothetical protein
MFSVTVSWDYKPSTVFIDNIVGIRATPTAFDVLPWLGSTCFLLGALPEHT